MFPLVGGLGVIRAMMLLGGLLIGAHESVWSAVPSYRIHLWQTEDGLPGNNVTSVLQTQDGYIWVGTRGGLARFDGVRFTCFDDGNTPEMQSRNVTCLFEAPDRTLWIGHEDGGVTFYKDGRFREAPLQASWRGGKIFGIGTDMNGDVWLVNQYGELARVRDSYVLEPPSGVTVHLLSLARIPGGGFWIQRDNEISALEHGQLCRVPLDEGTSNLYVQGICASGDGGLWVVTQSWILKWKNHEWTQETSRAPWQWSPVHTLLETRGGQLVGATADHGLYLGSLKQGWTQFSRTNGLPTDWVTSLCEDQEGDIWAGTGNGGLALLREVNVTSFNSADQWEGRAVLSVAANPKGGVWAGTEGAGLYCFQGEAWNRFDQQNGINHRYVWSVAIDTNARVWAGTWGGGVYVGDGTYFEHPPGLNDLTVPVAALLPSRDGGLYVGTAVGLLRYNEGKSCWLAVKPAVELPDVRAIREASDGAIWFGMSGGGLGCVENGTIKQFRRKDGLASDFVRCLHFEGETLWVGTSGGLNRLKQGQFSAITRKDALPNEVICDIQDDGLGYFWISSHSGIFRVGKAELNQRADGLKNELRFLTLGLSDGLPTLQCSGEFQPASCKTADGRLWFPTSKGLIAIDPKNVKTNPFPPPVILETVLVDGQPLAGQAAPLQVGPGHHRIEFQFTGLSFAAPEKVRFRHRLESVEGSWVEAGTKRSANYSYVPPGNYVFHVSACNNDGVWNEAGAALSFVVLPYFWQTSWFRAIAAAMMAAAGGGIAWLESRRRMHRKLLIIERQQALERERARIAKDIHDDLGAGLTRISLLSESVPSEEVQPAQAAEALNNIFATAHEMTQTMDEIVWAVNPRHDTLDSLATYLGKFAQDFLETAGVRCRLEMPIDLPCWRMEAEVRHNLFLAFKESLNNVLRHANATEVRISLAITGEGFIIVIQDNGKGFDCNGAQAAPLLSGRAGNRNGLVNMRQRLAQLGGRCEIASAVGQGTRVEFCAMLKPHA